MESVWESKSDLAQLKEFELSPAGFQKLSPIRNQHSGPLQACYSGTESRLRGSQGSSSLARSSIHFSAYLLQGADWKCSTWLPCAAPT